MPPDRGHLACTIAYQCPMPCCRCNRTGSCKGCACVKACNPCTSCLPSKLGSCVNCFVHSTVSTLFNAPPTTDLPANDVAAVFPAAEASEVSTSSPPLPVWFTIETDTRQSPTSLDSESQVHLSCPAYNRINVGEFDIKSSGQIINAAYEEIVHFKPNLFPIPSGSIGSQFVSIIAQLFQCFGDAARGGLAIKTAMVATQLLLQQSYQTVDRAAVFATQARTTE